MCEKEKLLVTSNFSFSHIVFYHFNPLPHGKILDLSKLKAFADDSFKVSQMVQFCIDRVENIVGKGENAGYQHFLLFPQFFQKASSPGSSKVIIVW